MAALALTVALFLFWGVVGLGTLAALHARHNLIQNILLAPAVGIAVTLLPVFYLNRLGWPVGRFGRALGCSLLLAGVCLIWRFRPILPFRWCAAFGVVCLLALWVTGRPMLRFGFGWLSYANDDMANYVLSSQRFLEHGFFERPDESVFVRSADSDLNYWFMHVVSGVRPGADLLLAWAASLTVLDTLQVFMPVILAFHLVLITATGALVCHSPPFRRASLVACVLLAFSALATLGVLYQLIGQVLGLALLCACTTVLLRPASSAGSSQLWRESLLSALLVSAIMIVYPEVILFMGAAVGLYTGIRLWRTPNEWKARLKTWAFIGGLSLVLLNTYMVSTTRFLRHQFQHGVKTPDLEFAVFPYFLLPSGLANLWGFSAIDRQLAEPWLSLAIVAGGILLLAAAGATAWRAWSGDPVAVMNAVLLAVGILLFIRRVDFGSFKLAMYIQPFLLGTLAAAWGRIARRRWCGK